ncbi:PREDICTED: C-C motif chemokine 23 isoform X2 [Mandrillus leucophaeus]|uniref:C-C motif chemokine 23 isoform X2 n=1 Tax=Mandrillus leucophaeus TaxID=9568 RepID=UPI0005F47AC4|nr:PREDICTED: C-C motif chemokine 23 isoform X2 [Mandrillus leucophaeus]
MKVSVAVLSCLMLVTALGSQAQVTNDAETGFMMSKLSLANPEVLDSFHAINADCCTSYIPGSIPCSLLESYLETSSKCPKPGVIFLTKNGRRLCVSPSNKQVLACRIMLKLATRIKARKN